MTCQKHREHALGRLAISEFEEHCRDCRACREAARQDLLLDELAAGISAPQPPAGMWERIEEAAQPDRERSGMNGWWRKPHAVSGWQIAAALALVVGLSAGSIWWSGRMSAGPAPRNILAADALARVETLEEQYVGAIEDLEALAHPALAQADLQLALRYRRRLEIVDAQIRRCQAVLAQDTANAHVRRYLLAAYQDKTETLTQLLAQAAPSGRDA